MKVYPKKGLRVAYEGRPKHYIAAAGSEVPERPYYYRRLRDGDLVLKPATDRDPEPKADPVSSKPRRRSRSIAEE